MATINEKLAAIQAEKVNIKNAIISKGVQVGDKLSDYATAIGNISGGETIYNIVFDENFENIISTSDELNSIFMEDETSTVPYSTDIDGFVWFGPIQGFLDEGIYYQLCYFYYGEGQKLFGRTNNSKNPGSWSAWQLQS